MEKETNAKIEEVLKFLSRHDIAHELLRHQPVVTCQDSAAVIFVQDCISCKSLFVKDKKTDNYYLAILPSDKRADMRGLAAYVGCDKFEFATQEKLLELLNTERGSVSPFSLLYEKQNKIIVLVDACVFESKLVKFHPNDNTATVVFDSSDLKKIFRILDKEVILV